MTERPLLDRLCNMLVPYIPIRLTWWVLMQCMWDIENHYGKPSEAYKAAGYLPKLWNAAQQGEEE